MLLASLLHFGRRRGVVQGVVPSNSQELLPCSQEKQTLFSNKRTRQRPALRRKQSHGLNLMAKLGVGV